MKLTKSRLKQIIKEELRSVITEYEEEKSPEELNCEERSKKYDIPMEWNPVTGKCEAKN